MPIPVKPMIEPGFCHPRWQSSSLPIENPSYRTFLESLDKLQVDYLDVSGSLAESKRLTGLSQFLRTDTHWTPQAMQHAVALLAEKLHAAGLPRTSEPMRLSRMRQTIKGLGDIVAMLRLPPASRLYPKEAVAIHPILRADGLPWSPDPRADTLVLGDSFFNIFSLEAMGWGASAGFVEQLSYALQRPLDAIIRNDAGALATRELLGQELARGNDRLNGKRIVVWEFAVRELATGNWDFVTLKTPAKGATDFLVLQAGEQRMFRATVKSFWSFPASRADALQRLSHRVSSHGHRGGLEAGSNRVSAHHEGPATDARGTVARGRHGFHSADQLDGC